MNLAMLSTLVAILERGSFAAAAQEVGCTPSAVSLQVKQLEAYFGRPLFDRSARSARPTSFAREAAMAAREVTGRLEALRTRPGMAVSGQIRVGAIASVQSDALPRALAALRRRHPGLEVRILLDDSDALQASLKAGRIDAAVLVRPQSGGSSRLIWQDLVRQPYVMLLPPGAEGSRPQELVQRYGVIRYDPSLTGGRIALRYLRQTFPRARYVMELRSIDAIVAMVSAGLAVAVVPQPRRALLEAHHVAELALGRRGPSRQIALVRRAADSDDRNIDAVGEALAGACAGRA
jgi:DNA-binding transcriptional LysR family regulator